MYTVPEDTNSVMVCVNFSGQSEIATSVTLTTMEEIPASAIGEARTSRNKTTAGILK